MSNSLKNQVSPTELLSYDHWIFDMDGTLTIAQHDFDAIRDELGLPVGLPILESLDKLSDEESAPLHVRLNQIELDIAGESKAAEGAQELLETLLSNGANIGILTRNNKINIDVTLKAAGLADYFTKENLLSRDCAKPKPAPDGILQLLNQWGASSKDAIMIGDHLHDLQTGKAAGTQTLYVDPSGDFIFKKDADMCIHQLTELLKK